VACELVTKDPGEFGRVLAMINGDIGAADSGCFNRDHDPSLGWLGHWALLYSKVTRCIQYRCLHRLNTSRIVYLCA
jgi:hypothetical protein